ncbi:cobalamin biosynthesis protein [Rhodococcus sp. NPDC058532]|uniref:cobalamin biosynthesis protein n=1 Tax=Rhodococcus sp. NPDC058532 TaxID=3346540 RepID=UPI0036585C42
MKRPRISARATGIALGYLADRVFADPVRWHPVAGFGSAAAALERCTHRDSRAAGAVHTGLLVGAVVGGTALAARAAGRLGWAGETAVVAAATWISLGGTSLTGVGFRMADRLAADDLSGARALVPSLCARDPDLLDATGIARATVESVAENTSDATVAPLVWAAVAGAPGALGYRAINTLDAMIGYRSPKYLRFGWAAARLDDAVNLAPARVTGLLTAAAAPVVGGSPRAAALAWRRDASAHPSPNAGVAEASMAGALGIALGGRTEYAYGAEDRPTLGAGPAPGVGDIARVARLSTVVQAGAAVAAVLVASAFRRRPGGCRVGHSGDGPGSARSAGAGQRRVP